VDGNSEDRRGTVSVFNGPAPEIETFDDPEQECEAVAAWVKGRIQQGIQPHEIGVFVRSSRELRRARNAIKQVGIQAVEFSDRIEITPGKISIGTMHLAKGLDPFRYEPSGVSGNRRAVVGDSKAPKIQAPLYGTRLSANARGDGLPAC
jgi:superfamily I DNA/RNA helicase